MTIRSLAVAIALVACIFAAAVAAPRATAAGRDPGAAMLGWAEGHAYGHVYAYGGTGPGYDCSGLIYASARAAGITLPRTTYAMLAGSGHLYRIPLSQARRGDLLFYGSGHVEFDTSWWHTSFGAHDTGSRVGWIRWGGSWAPTMAMRVR